MTDPARTFWSKVNKRGPDECWPWKAGTRGNGYGRMWLEGRGVSAHRFSWELHTGETLGAVQVLHHCDNPPCVNPKHLFTGGPKANSDDKIAKNRQSKGNDISLAKLTPELVTKVREMAANGAGIRAIARSLGIDHSNISRTVNRKAWRHIDE